MWIEIPGDAALDTFAKGTYLNSTVGQKRACIERHQSRLTSVNILWASVLTNALAEVFAKILFTQFPLVFGQWTLAPHLW